MTGEIPEVVREELDPVPLYPTWISHKISWAQNRVSANFKQSVSHHQFLFQLMHHNFTLLTKSLYMFRAPTCPSSGGQTIHTPQLVQLRLL